MQLDAASSPPPLSRTADEDAAPFPRPLVLRLPSPRPNPKQEKQLIANTTSRPVAHCRTAPRTRIPAPTGCGGPWQRRGSRGREERGE
jgi:hypothetical protein